jgi:hypothetical protein
MGAEINEELFLKLFHDSLAYFPMCSGEEQAQVVPFKPDLDRRHR